MRSPHNRPVLILAIALAFLGSRVQAAPPSPAPTKSVGIPDYGGRDTPGAAMTGGNAAADPNVGEAAPNPLAQAWRACEALALVLGGIIAVVYGLKRFGIVREGETKLNWARGLSRPVSGNGPIRIVSSQALPGGAMLHVVSVAGRTLLLAATGQTVSLISELPSEPVETPTEDAAFSAYLSQAGLTLPPESPVAAATDRLKSLLARSQSTGNL